MALLSSEIYRIKAELGFNLLTVGAEPYIGITALFDQIVKPYLSSGAITTSSTVVTQQSAPTAIALTLASAVGFSQFDRVVIDVDGAQEAASVRAISGSAITVLLSGAHSGTYPITVEGGEAIVREKLAVCLALGRAMAGATTGAGALKQVDEVSWYQSVAGKTTFEVIRGDLMLARDELAAAVGVANMWRSRGAASSRLSVY
jgi:hypothetical protein